MDPVRNPRNGLFELIVQDKPRPPVVHAVLQHWFAVQNAIRVDHSMGVRQGLDDRPDTGLKLPHEHRRMAGAKAAAPDDLVERRDQPA